MGDRTLKSKAFGLGLIASIAVVLMCMFCPVKAMADEAVAFSVGDGGQEANYFTYQSAVEAGYDGNVIVMASDWNVNEQINIGDNQSVTIDMNGHVIFNYEDYGSVFSLGERSSLTMMSSQTNTFVYQGFSSTTGELEEYSVTSGGLATDGSKGDTAPGFFRVGEGSTLTLDNITIAGNLGGTSSAIWMEKQSFLFMKNGTSIQHNKSSDSGGVYCHGDGASISMDNSSISNNYVHNEGGAIYSLYDAVKMNMRNHSEIACNSAGRGGAIYMKGTYYEIKSSDRTGKIWGNVARKSSGTTIREIDGGAITIDDPKLGQFVDELGLIEGLTISDNRVENYDRGYGGGIYLFQDDTRIVDCVITGNSAGKEGGGVYVDCNVDVELSGKVIIAQNKRGNSADDLFLGDDLFHTAYIIGAVDEGSYIGVRTGYTDDHRIGKNITAYTPGTFFMDLGGYYVTKGTDCGGDLWQRHGDHKFAVMLQGKSIGDYYPGETVTIDASTGNDYLVFSQWLEDESSGLFPFVDYVEDRANSTLTFTMPQNDVNLWHSLKILPPEKPAPGPAPRPTV